MSEASPMPIGGTAAAEANWPGQMWPDSATRQICP